MELPDKVRLPGNLAKLTAKITPAVVAAAGMVIMAIGLAEMAERMAATAGVPKMVMPTVIPVRLSRAKAEGAETALHLAVRTAAVAAVAEIMAEVEAEAAILGLPAMATNMLMAARAVRAS